jgi:hypothetical protein
VAKAFGLRLCLIVFSIETFAGLLEGQEFEDTIQSAFLFAVIFWGLGLLLGEVARQVVEELVRSQLIQNTKLHHQLTSNAAKSTGRL